jgi:CubicO group peptidase (beta-lactamase class C family)
MREGRLIYAGAPDTLYQTASLGKHFTAALAILLARSGSGIALDEPVAPLLPELPPDWAAITLRQLLSHTAGVPSAGYNSVDLERDYTDAALVISIASGGALDFSPGEGWQYSNAGYVLAGIAIGRRTGRFYGDLMSELIFQPFGMTTARVNGPDAPIGYVQEGDNMVHAEYVSPTLNRVADGAITLTVLDLARWEAALSGPWGAQVSEMFIETKLRNGEPTGYGLGWSLSHTDHGRVAEHEGLWQGFSTAMVRYMDEGIAAAVLANLADVDAIGLAHALATATAAAHRTPQPPTS